MSMRAEVQTEKTYAVLCDIRIYPFRQHIGCLGEQELSISIDHSHPGIGELSTQFAQQIYDQPLVFCGITKVGTSTQ